MCGLSGFAGDIGRLEEDIFKDLLLFNTVRGADSTGAASIPRYERDEVQIARQVGPGCDLLRSTAFYKLMAPTHAALLGHNRSMTRGAVRWRNCHPFEFENTVGMHNGTLHWGQDKLPQGNKFETDSEAIIHSIDIQGPEKTIPLLEGSYTLIWWDRRKHSINMIRNEERPLFYALREDGKVLVFASELDILVAACRRDGSRKWIPRKWMMLPIDNLYSWKIPEHSKPFEEPERMKLEGAKRSTYSGDGSNHSSFQGGSGNSTHTPFRRQGVGPSDSRTGTSGTGKESSDGSSETSKSDTGKVIKFPGQVKGTFQESGEFKGWYLYVETGDSFKVFRDPDNNSWVTCTRNGVTKDWDRHVTKTAPASVKLPVLHAGDHKFVHKGKKKKKVIYFRGWGGAKLTKEEFEGVASFGCASCSRRPEWGNDVTFLNEHYDFLCGLCSLDKPLVEMWKAVGA